MTELVPLKICVYINGVRFWPRSVSVTAAAGSHLSFSVDVPAVPEWDLLPPRAHAVVFFLDPVENSWRMLCEGEYRGPAWSKSATGVRSRLLQFRDIHGMWETTTFTAISSLVGSQATQTVVRTMAEGKNVVGASSGTNERPMSIEAMISKVTEKNTRLSAFFGDLLQLVTSQTPVESFFAVSRKLASKVFSFKDDQIGSVVDALRFQDCAKNGVNQTSLDANARLEEILLTYEDMAMYQHVPVPAPPIYRGEDAQIPEMLFMPHVYTVIPPACNVIFEQQITNESGSRHLLNEPTRAVVQLSGILDVQPQNVYYMANSADDAINVVAQEQTKVNDPVLAMTHDKFSADELRSGVVVHHVPIGLERVQNTANPTGSQQPADMDTYLAQAARHYYEMARGLYRTTSLSCTFLPYLVPGFPTLIEDASGPKFGVIQSVTHTLPCTGSPSTSVDVRFVRDLYVIEGKNRTSPVPNWLNSMFWPINVVEFYKNAFGKNYYDLGDGYRSAMVSAKEIIDNAKTATQVSPLDASSQCNIDALAAKVIPVPVYTEGYVRSDAPRDQTVSERLATSNDPVAARIAYQWRPGVSLEAYLSFHGLTATIRKDDVDPPADLSPTTTSGGEGHPLFGHAFGLSYIGPSQGSPYGYYDLVPAAGGVKISSKPQVIARAIQAAIDRGITRV